jgi:hypothetical protein
MTDETNEPRDWLYGGGAERERAGRGREKQQEWIRQMFSKGQEETPRSRRANQLLDLVATSPSTRRLRSADDPAPAGEPGSDEEVEALREWLRSK